MRIGQCFASKGRSIERENSITVALCHDTRVTAAGITFDGVESTRQGQLQEITWDLKTVTSNSKTLNAFCDAC